MRKFVIIIERILYSTCVNVGQFISEKTLQKKMAGNGENVIMAAYVELKCCTSSFLYNYDRQYRLYSNVVFRRFQKW